MAEGWNETEEVDEVPGEREGKVDGGPRHCKDTVRRTRPHGVNNRCRSPQASKFEDGRVAGHLQSCHPPVSMRQSSKLCSAFLAVTEAHLLDLPKSNLIFWRRLLDGCCHHVDSSIID